MIKRISFLAIIFFLIFLIINCEGVKKRTILPSDVNFSVEYDKNFDHTIYPSLIVGLSNQFNRQTSDFFTFKLKSPIDKSVLRIKIEETPLSSETIFQTQLGARGSEYQFSPVIKWKYDKLKQISQQGTVDFTFICYVNDEEVSVENMRLNYRSINECVLGLVDTSNKYVDYKWMFAAYVNEEHPWIDELLKEMLQEKIVNSFLGYQGNSNNVKDQVFALWYHLQEKGVKYSSIANTSRVSKKIIAQYVRFFDQVYQNQQANCVDACVFFASVLKRIGLSPFLVSEPGHMYLGFYKTPERKDVYLLETTLIGEVDLSEIKEENGAKVHIEKYRKYLTPNVYESYEKGAIGLKELKEEISRSTFNKALLYDVKRYNSNLSKMRDPKNRAYQIYDIGELRKLVQPIGR